MLKKIQLFMAALMVVLFVFISAALGAQAIEWKSYPEGYKAAKKQNKKIFLHFRTDWCGYCRKMDALTFTDESVIEFINQYFIAIKVDGDRETSVTKAYRANAFPDNRFLDSSQKEVFRIPGFISAEHFLIYLEYIHTDSYKTMDAMEYYKSR